MTVYAPVPAYAGRKRHPRALVLIIAGHVALLAAVMSAKMDLPRHFVPTRTEVDLIPLPPEPALKPSEPTAQQRNSVIVPVTQVVPTPPVNIPAVAPEPVPAPTIGEVVMNGLTTAAEPVRIGPRSVTPASELRPPYPQQKLRLEEEAVLRLKLSIDDRGRVIAVNPVGRADPVFLAAARRHLLARWRYKPATEDGRAVASSTVVTLRFQLDD